MCVTASPTIMSCRSIADRSSLSARYRTASTPAANSCTVSQASTTSIRYASTLRGGIQRHLGLLHRTTHDRVAHAVPLDEVHRAAQQRLESVEEAEVHVGEPCPFMRLELHEEI